MAIRRKIAKRPAVVEYEEPDDEELEDEELEDEAPAPQPRRAATVTRRPQVVEEEDDDDDEDDLLEEDDEEDEPLPAPKAVARKVVPSPIKKVALPAANKPASKAPAPKAAASEQPALPVKVQKVATDVAGMVLIGLLQDMEVGKSVTITQHADGKWTFTTGVAASAGGPKLRGKEYWDTVLTNEYKAWQEEWSTLTYAEKRAKAKKMGAKWESHSDERVDNIRISAAVQAKLGIEKYKPEYQSKAAQARLKG